MSAPSPGKNGGTTTKGRDLTVATGLLLVFFAMLGASYAAVPLYKVICQATGINGTTQRVAGNLGGKVLDRVMTIHFDANVGSGMPWHFKPETEHISVHVGETTMAYFTAANPSDHAITGSATFNVTPEIVGRYFDKIQCFCFDLQTLKAGETAEMPVTFYIDPAIAGEASADTIRDVTLSYTFFQVPSPVAPSTAAAPTPAAKVKGS